MLRIMNNSKSAMNALQEKMDCISNNLANMNTNGYKRENVNFSDLVYETMNRKGNPITDNKDRKIDPYNGTGMKAGEWIRDNSQGSLEETKKSTDLAIDGKGYFKVKLNNPIGENTEAYIRSGDFNIDGNGNLTDKNGNILEIQFDGEKRALKEGNFNIDEKGNIIIKEDNKYEKVGNIKIYDAIGEDAFQSVGKNLYVPSNKNVNIIVNKDVDIKQGFLERSNVDMTQEISDLILTQRAFELNSKGIKTSDEMWSMVNNLRGK